MTGTSDLIHFDRPYRRAKLYPAQFSRSCPQPQGRRSGAADEGGCALP
jgi:hypothetical protein